MNEGEKNGFSTGPVFSSPNIAGSQPQSQEPIPMPEQPVDITKVGNPSLTTTVAAMPEQDGPEKPAVSSGGNPMNKKQPRFGFATRRFRGKAQAAVGPVMQAAETPTFANAPDFFNDAVNDIELADEADKKGKTKKFLMIGGIAVAAIVLFVFGIIALSSGNAGGQKQAKASLANRLKNIIANGEDKSDAIDLKIEKASDYRKLFIYRDADFAKTACEKTNALIDEVAKNKDLGMLQEDIKNVCQDMSYRQLPLAAILLGSETLRRDAIEQYIDNFYSSREIHREVVESIRVAQAQELIGVIDGLNKAGCLSGRDIKGACQYEYYRTKEYDMLSRPIVDAEKRFEREIMRELNAILDKIDGKETKND